MQELDKYMLFASTKKRSAYPERPDDDAVERKNVQRVSRRKQMAPNLSVAAAPV